MLLVMQAGSNENDVTDDKLVYAFLLDFFIAVFGQNRMNANEIITRKGEVLWQKIMEVLQKQY